MCMSGMFIRNYLFKSASTKKEIGIKTAYMQVGTPKLQNELMEHAGSSLDTFYNVTTFQ